MSTGAGVGAAANIVGGELQGWAALLDKWAMGDAYKKQADEQAGFAKQAGQVIDKRIAGAGADVAGQQMQQGAGNREAGYKSVNATPLSLQGSALSPQMDARNSAYVGLLRQQRAKLGSYGDWLQQQWMSNQGTNRQLGQVQDFARGSANVFPIQMYAAQHSMDDLAAIGQAISSIGGGSSNYAALFNSAPQKASQRYATGNDFGGEMSLSGGGGGGQGNDFGSEINI